MKYILISVHPDFEIYVRIFGSMKMAHEAMLMEMRETGHIPQEEDFCDPYIDAYIQSVSYGYRERSAYITLWNEEQGRNYAWKIVKI